MAVISLALFKMYSYLLIYTDYNKVIAHLTTMVCHFGYELLS